MEDFKRVEPVTVRDFKTSAHLLTEFMCSEESPTFRSLHSLLFRGESSAKFSLIPSALRPEKQNEFRRLAEAAGLIVENGGRPLNEDEHIDCELQLIKFFYKTANQKGLPLPPLPYKWHERLQNHWLMTNDDQLKEWIPVELAETVALMQHYGFPTRMLDWSTNILTALYFAAHGAAQRLKDKEADNTDYMVIWILEKPIDTGIKLSPKDTFPIRFVTPSYAGNPNLSAQKGVLTYVPAPLYSQSMDYVLPLDQYLKQFYAAPNHACFEPVLTKARIPINNYKHTLKILSSFGIDDTALFPGYSSIMRQLDEKVVWLRNDTA